MPLASYSAQGFAGSPTPELISLISRWRYMTDEAKALTKRTAVSALVVLLVLLVFRALVSWVLVALPNSPLIRWGGATGFLRTPLESSGMLRRVCE